MNEKEGHTSCTYVLLCFPNVFFSMHYHVAACHDEKNASPLCPSDMFVKAEHGSHHAEHIRQT